ncbi:MAG: hypothetical protein WC477_02435 [Patescibacteria group bacterium]
MPTVFIAGIIVGLASVYLIAQFPIPKAVQKVVQQVPENQSSTTTDQKNLERGIYSLGQINVAWTEPKELSMPEMRNLILNSTTNTEFAERALSSADISSKIEETQCDSLVRKIWSLGKVKGGDFDGLEVYYADVQEMCGMGGGPDDYDFLIQKHEDGVNALYWIVNDLNAYQTNIYSNQTADPFFRIIRLAGGEFSDLKMPKTLKLVGGGVMADMLSNSVLVPLSIRSKMKPIATTENGISVYERPDSLEHNGFLRPRSFMGIFDIIGRFEEYASYIDAENYESSTSSAYFDPDISSKGIEWKASLQNLNFVTSTQFSPTLHNGCGNGAQDYVNVKDQNALEQIGTVNGMQAIYAPKNFKEYPLTQGEYDQWLSLDDKKKSMDEFLSENPVPYFLWKDALGNWIEYKNSDILPQVECGKPVIYLYPTKTTDVTVRLPKFIHVTVSDPAYPINGWNVTASSSGMLISRDDGKIYDSLYWEGTGVNYQTPKTGFVVKGSNVASFLASTLPKYGLNAKETKDFMDFWVPKIQGVPYARISFLTDTWSKAAPLSVTPRPMTSIRIFMDWKPLSAPISIQAPKIVTPVRNGFTLVEWGGTLYK